MANMNISNTNFVAALNAEELPISAFRTDKDSELTEHLQFYGPDKLHPTHINDAFYDGRYVVAAKLAHDPRCLSWLVRDLRTQTWRRLDINLASRDTQATFIKQARSGIAEREKAGKEKADAAGMATDWFVHQGPNGHHVCVVFPLNGSYHCFRWAVNDDTQMNEAWFVRRCAKLRKERGDPRGAPRNVHDISREEMVRILGGLRIIVVTPELRFRANVEKEIYGPQLPRYLTVSPPRIDVDFEYWLSPEAFQKL